jgi:hypothetical protein
MVASDASVWVDYFNGVVTPATDTLDAALGRQAIFVGDLGARSVRQGFRRQADFAQARNSSLCMNWLKDSPLQRSSKRVIT